MGKRLHKTGFNRSTDPVTKNYCVPKYLRILRYKRSAYDVNTKQIKKGNNKKKGFFLIFIQKQLNINL